MTIAVINLINEIFKQILPKKRYHLGMTFGRMMEKCCEHLGMTLNSKLLQVELKDWVHIPQKNRKGGSSGEQGFPTNTESIHIFGGLIRQLKEMFNADYRIIGNVFHFERKDSFKIPSTYKMPDFFSDQDRLLDKFRLNADEMISNYNIYWALDIQDQNTLEDSSGRVFQAITSPNSVGNKDLVTIKNLAEIAIPFSLGKEKRNLTPVEEVAKVLGGIVDGLTGLFGNGTNFKNQIEARIGCLLLSSDFLTVGKVVKMSGGKLANNQRTELDAKIFWENWHYINSFAMYKGVHNQYFRYKEQPVPMEAKEFFGLMSNNLATDDKGNQYEIEVVVYNPQKSTALIDYRIKKQYTKNLKIKII